MGDAIPELIHHICYMAAYCCSNTLPTINNCMAAPESGSAIVPANLVVGDPQQLGVSRYNFLGGGSSLTTARAAPDVGRLVAHTPLDRPQSGRVLEKAGFAIVREVDDADEAGNVVRVKEWEQVV